MTTQRMLQILIALLGIVNTATGLALLLAPEWFFQNIGNYAPYNRHYEGDLGSFITAVGIGLLWAARDPLKYRALVGVALISNVLHFVNHVHDDVIVSASFASSMSGAVPVGFQMLLLALAYALASRPQETARRRVKGMDSTL